MHSAEYVIIILNLTRQQIPHMNNKFLVNSVLIYRQHLMKCLLN